MSLTYSPTSLEKGLKTVFVNSFEGQTSYADQICYVESSASDKEKYEWLGQAPQMTELKGQRIVTPLTDTGYELENKIYTSTIEIQRKHLDDNQTGSVKRRIAQMAVEASGHVNKLVIDTLVNGTSATLGLCYDGSAFFGNSHPVRADEGAVQDNLAAGTGTSTSACAVDFGIAKGTLLSFKSESGSPFHGDGGGTFAVVAPPQMEKAWNEVLGAGMISNTTNMQSGMAQLIISPRLSDVDDWYLLRTDHLRGLIFQERDALEFAALESNTESAFMRESYHYGCRARYASGYGFWQSAVKTVN